MSYKFLINGSTETEIINAYDALRSARYMGWDTSWWEDKANTMRIKSDAQWDTVSTLHVLLNRTAFNNISPSTLQQIKLPTGEVNIATTRNPYGLAASTTTYKGWVFREARAIDPSVDPSTYSISSGLPDFTPDSNQTVLATFEDARCLFQGSFLDQSYNTYYGSYFDVLNAAANGSNNAGYEPTYYHPDSLYTTGSLSTPWTWKQVIDHLITYLPNGTLINTNGFEAISHNGVQLWPENLSCGQSCYHKTPWQLFCAILEATGHTLVYDPTLPAFYVRKLSSGVSTTGTLLATSLSNLNTSTPQLLGTTNPTGRDTFLPEKVRVVFPTADYISKDASFTDGTVPQDTAEVNDTYAIEKNTVAYASGTPFTVTKNTLTINAEGYLYRTTTRYEQTSPAPPNLRPQQLEAVANEIVARYVYALQTPSTEWTMIGARPYMADQFYPEFLVRFGTVKNLELFNALYNAKDDLEGLSIETLEMALGNPETTVYSRPPFDYVDYTPQAQAPFFFPHEKLAYVQVNQSGGIATGKLGTCYLLRPMIAVDETPDPDEYKWEFTGTTADMNVVNLTGATLENGSKHTARYDYRLGQWAFFPISATPTPIQDELRGEVDAIYAAGASGNTYRVFRIKTSSPAPVPLPTNTPALTGTQYVADIQDKGAEIEVGDSIRAIYSGAIDSYNPGGGAVDVDWEFLPFYKDIPVPFTCVITASLTGATWSNANKRLTPAANTSTAKLLGWDSANSRYDEATDGTTISPEWVSTADVTIDSSKCLIGKGVYYDGRYMLMEIDCPDTDQQDYT